MTTHPMQASNDRSLTALGIAFGSRVVGLSIADSLGIQEIHLRRCSRQGERHSEATISWLIDLIDTRKPSIVAIEAQRVWPRTSSANCDLNVIPKFLVHFSHLTVINLDRRIAVEWLCAPSLNGKGRARPSVRLAARILAEDHHEPHFNQAPKKPYRTNWDRTWAHCVAASALALYVLRAPQQSEMFSSRPGP